MENHPFDNDRGNRDFWTGILIILAGLGAFVFALSCLNGCSSAPNFQPVPESEAWEKMFRLPIGEKITPPAKEQTANDLRWDVSVPHDEVVQMNWNNHFVAPGDIAGLAVYPNLTELNLNASDVTPEKLREIRALAGIKKLILGDCWSLRAPDLGLLQSQGQLEDLSINGSGIKGPIAEYLEGLKSLKTLMIHEGQVPETDLARLRAKHPGLDIRVVAPPVGFSKERSAGFFISLKI